MFLPLPYCRWFKDHISLCPSTILVQVFVELLSKAATEAAQPEEMLRKQKKE